MGKDHPYEQNINQEYEVGDEFRLADWNGDLNGGNYHIIFIDNKIIRLFYI